MYLKWTLNEPQKLVSYCDPRILNSQSWELFKSHTVKINYTANYLDICTSMDLWNYQNIC